MAYDPPTPRDAVRCLKPGFLRTFVVARFWPRARDRIRRAFSRKKKHRPKSLTFGSPSARGA
eukprot:6328512-Lingulodinium_polyedra.AAC.1